MSENNKENQVANRPASKVRKRLMAYNQEFVSITDIKVRRRRKQTAENGQDPYAIVICCSDSRVIPEQIFGASIGDLFVIRVAGNVLDDHALGSVEYAAAHLGVKLVLMMGHTNCGAVGAALEGGAEGFIRSITDDIREAIGDEKDPVRASELNVLHGVKRLKDAFGEHHEMQDVEIAGAMYDIRTGEVRWL